MTKIRKSLFWKIFICLLWQMPQTTAQDVEFSDHSHLSKLILEIIMVKVPSCDLVVISDHYFKHRLITWLKSVENPVVILTLDNKDFKKKKLDKRQVVKPSGFSFCTNFIIACHNIHSCRTNNSKYLFKLLWFHGFWKKRKRTFIFIHNETVSSLTPPDIFDGPRENRKYKSQVVEYAVEVQKELKSHITLIRKLNTKDILEYRTYQLLTWTPNWIPGGSPIIFNIWSTDRGFWNPVGLKILRRHLRSGGSVRFCMYSKNLLPWIQIDNETHNNHSGPTTQSPHGHSTTDNTHVHGIDAELIKIFAMRFNLSVSFYEAEDNDVGSEREDGSWSGVFGQVLEKNADIGVGQIVFTPSRLGSNLKFSPPFIPFEGVVVCPFPGFLPRWGLLMEPFDVTTWFGLLISMLAVLCLFKTYQHLTRKLFKCPEDGHNRTRESRLAKPKRKIKTRWFSWIYGACTFLHTPIPTNVIPQRKSFLILLGFWILFTYIMSIAYSTLLISSLSIPPEETPIETLRDLRFSTKHWVVSKLVNQVMRFSNATLQRFENFLLAHRSESETRGVIDVLGYKYVNDTGNCFIADRSRAEYVISTRYMQLVDHRIKPLMRVSRRGFILGPTGWILRDDTDFVLITYIDSLFLGLKAHGIIDKIKEKFRPPFYGELEEAPEALGFDSVEVIFEILLLGLSISTLVFIAELFHYKLARIWESIFDRIFRKPLMVFGYLP